MFCKLGFGLGLPGLSLWLALGLELWLGFTVAVRAKISVRLRVTLLEFITENNVNKHLIFHEFLRKITHRLGLLLFSTCHIN